MRKRTNIPTMAPSLLMRSMSVILTALADLTRNMTDILQLDIGGDCDGGGWWRWRAQYNNSCVPPSFQHECTVGESKANLSEPNPESAGHNVRTRVED